MSHESDLLQRLMSKDTTLWPQPNVANTRLGWTDIADRMNAEAADIAAWASTVTQSKIVLIGMGGSSLGPEVLHSAVNDNRLFVLDTTDPATVASVDTSDAFFLVASKSGSTLEIKTLLAHFWELVPDGSRYAAITDPNTELHQVATERNFSKIFVNDPDIGGRYSVLSYFGLVPAALIGYDVAELTKRAGEVDGEAAVTLGLQMALSSQAGCDKITIKTPPEFAAFGLWVEQLIAESTGKHGKGCIPIPTIDDEEGTDRFHVSVNLDGPNDLGREFLHWEIATAIAGHGLDIDPFDEPNVAESKANTAKVLDSLPIPDPTTDVADAGKASAWVQQVLQPGDYVSIQCYLPFGDDEAMAQARRTMRDALGGAAVTIGYGPRFLHSTGQLHKGGPNNIVAVQVVTPSAFEM